MFELLRDAIVLRGVYTLQLTLPIWLLLPIGGMIGAALGVLLEILVFRPIRNRAADAETGSLAILISSVAVGALLFEVSDWITDGKVRSINSDSFVVETFDVGRITVSNIQILIVVIALALSVGLAVFVSHTRTGKALRALAFVSWSPVLLSFADHYRAAIQALVVVIVMNEGAVHERI